MVKDFSYILKRVIIGVLIALILMLLKGGLIANVNAQSIYTIDINTTSMVDLDSSQEYTFNMPTNSFKNLGRGEILFSYYMTDYSDFATWGQTNRSAIPRYMYVSTHSGSRFVCNIGSLGYDKTSSTLWTGSGGTFMPNSNAAMMSVFSATCPVELNDDDYVSSITAFQVGVGANTYAQFGRYISFIKDTQSEVKESIDKQTEETKKQTDAITSDESPSDSDIESIFENEDDSSSSPVSDLITMPITLLEKLNNGFSGSCGSYNLGSLYGHNIILPCIDMVGLLGSELWTLIDMLFSLFLVYNIGLMVISIYESITSLEDGFRSLYTPKHAEHEYEPKHGGGD